MLSGIFYWTTLPFRASLVGTHPVFLVLLNGSTEGIVAAAAFARIGHGTLIVVLLAALVGIMKFDPLYWWAGRLWGERVIALRVDGKSFKAIAADLDLGRSKDAFAVFVEAVRRRPKAEQAQLRAGEGKRLDALERWTRRKSEPDEMDRKLAIVNSLRATLAAT